MYAIIATGGKQYKVEPGQLLRLEKLPAEVGQTIEIKPVLLVGGEGETKIGQPFLEGHVTATVIEQGKGRKVLVFKKKRRKGYKVKRGHRQLFTAVRIQAIQA
jgi:large subunit ribosomal protein L21